MFTKGKLTHIARKFLAEEYGINLTCGVEFNGRLKRALARYVYKDNPKYTNAERAQRIEMSKDLMKYGTEEQIIDCLKHECVHLALHYLDKPFNDGHPYFEGELKRLGVAATNVYRINKPRHVFKCVACGEKLTSVRKLSPSKFHHKPCGVKEGKLKYVGTEGAS